MITPQLGPDGGLGTVTNALPEWVPGIATLKDAGRVGAPLPVYVVDASSALDLKTATGDQVLAAAKAAGWDYPIFDGAAAGIAHLRQQADGALVVAGISHGRVSQRVLDAAALADQTLGNDGSDYEPRLLHLPALRIKALWLRGASQDRFIFISNSNPAVAAPLRIDTSIDGCLQSARTVPSARRKKGRGATMGENGNNGLNVTLGLILAAAAIVAMMVGIDKTSVHLGLTRLFFGWVIELALMVAFVAVLGRRLEGDWAGVLVDGRNKISLSRLQIVMWTILFVPTLLVLFVWNASFPGKFDLAVPTTVWALMGMSGFSAAVAPAILSAKPDAGAAPPGPTPSDPNKFVDGVVVKRRPDADPEWADILLGDDAGNSEAIDISKVQQLLLSGVAVLAYAYAIAAAILTAKVGTVGGLPEFSTGFLGLIAASHATYLVYKGVSHTN